MKNCFRILEHEGVMSMMGREKNYVKVQRDWKETIP